MGTTYNSDGSQSNVQTLINGSVSGDTVTIPAGSFTWGSAVTISGKGITLSGAGAGRVVARSATSLTVGTGSKVWTLTAEGVASIEALKSAITNGVTLRIYRTGGAVSGGTTTGALPWMEGTVTSLVGTTLTMNITSTNSSGTHPSWIVIVPATTVITNNAGSSTLLQITESISNSVEVSNFRIENGTGTGDFVSVTNISGGKSVLMHNMFFYSGNINSSYDCLQWDSNRGVIWDCSFVALPFSPDRLAIHQVPANQTTSWTTVSTMGTADSTGTSNLYVEDCDFHAWNNATDCDENARISIRYCLFDNAAFGSHGADSSNYGMRHFEVYASEFFRNSYSDGQTLNLNWFFLLRGGTGVITNCIIPLFTGTDYGGTPAFKFSVWNLQYNGGPNPVWGMNTGATGANYPCPRQFGRGYINGTSTASYSQTGLDITIGNYVVNGTTDVHISGSPGPFGGTFVGDLEPLYIWNIPSVNPLVLVNDYNFAAGPARTAGEVTPEIGTNYIQANRDYYYDTSHSSAGAKPNWSPYAYPQPLRSNNSGPILRYKRLSRYIKLSGLAG